jgi:hypothetical protein
MSTQLWSAGGILRSRSIVQHTASPWLARPGTFTSLRDSMEHYNTAVGPLEASLQAT